MGQHDVTLFPKLRSTYTYFRNETLQASRLNVKLIILINNVLITPPET